MLSKKTGRRFNSESVSAGRDRENGFLAAGLEVDRLNQFQAAFRFLWRESVFLAIGNVQGTRCDEQGQFRKIEIRKQSRDGPAAAVRVAVANETDPHAAEDSLDAGGSDSRFHRGGAQRQQAASGNPSDTDPFGIH